MKFALVSLALGLGCSAFAAPRDDVASAIKAYEESKQAVFCVQAADASHAMEGFNSGATQLAQATKHQMSSVTSSIGLDRGQVVVVICGWITDQSVSTRVR